MKGGVKMEKGQLWTIIAVSLVVAVVTSIATASITGNVIRLKEDRRGEYKVYTTAEIDAKLQNVTTNQGVIDMLNRRCSIWSAAVSNATRQVTGDDICKEKNAGTCILMINYDRFSSNDMIQKCTPYVTGRSDTTTAYCCKP